MSNQEKKLVIFLSFILCFIIFSSICAFSWDMKGPIYGYILDDKGAPIEGVQVNLIAKEEGEERAITTDKSGFYNVDMRIGKGSSKMGFMKSSMSTKVTLKKLNVTAKKEGYKDFSGDVLACAAYADAKKMKARLFMSEIVLMPADSDKNAYALNNAYFKFGELKVEPKEGSIGDKITVSAFFSMPNDKWFRENTKVTAKSSQGDRYTFQLYDNGESPDEASLDGIYTGVVEINKKFPAGEMAYTLTSMPPGNVNFIFSEEQEIKSTEGGNTFNIFGEGKFLKATVTDIELPFSINVIEKK